MTIARAISRIVFYCRRHHYGEVCLRIAACAVLAAVFSSPHLALATTVRMITTLGTIDIQLYDDQTPKTVANFLRYAGRGDYNNVIIHRSVPGFVIQGGGYKCCNAFNQSYHIATDPSVQNEFDPSRSNVLGTIAMAKVGSDPNSATSEWFFNLANNGGVSPLGLDFQNGGFTVFGSVLAPGMNVVNAIANLQIKQFAAPFDSLPVVNYNTSLGLQLSNFVLVTSIPNISATKTLSGATSVFTADVDMTFSPGSVKTIDAATSTSWLATFTPPPNKTVQFNDGIFTFKITGTMPSGRIVTLLNGGATNPNHYYAYGPTPDNAAPHWYDFTFDGTTGAEIIGNKILLHFVDGQRGDDDLTVNNSITHTGAPALVTDIATGSTTFGGCSIAAAPSQMRGNGDWIVVGMFLVFVAVVRKRTRRIGRVGIAHRK